MKNPLRHLTVVTLVWLVGLAASVVLVFAIGPQGQCAADVGCGRMADRWWHTPLMVLVALGPGAMATLIWWWSDDPDV
ncbi:MAG TPA: hypothetical protein VGQ18_01890 [Gemmatimonadales bacterium]|nr:hypothetical protein [Gemmatimonadales bacterium]